MMARGGVAIRQMREPPDQRVVGQRVRDPQRLAPELAAGGARLGGGGRAANRYS
jgi:uncharacterized protein (DUF1786 family)